MLSPRAARASEQRKADSGEHAGYAHACQQRVLRQLVLASCFQRRRLVTRRRDLQRGVTAPPGLEQPPGTEVRDRADVQRLALLPLHAVARQPWLRTGGARQRAAKSRPLARHEGLHELSSSSARSTSVVDAECASAQANRRRAASTASALADDVDASASSAAQASTSAASVRGSCRASMRLRQLRKRSWSARARFKGPAGTGFSRRRYTRHSDASSQQRLATDGQAQ